MVPLGAPPRRPRRLAFCAQRQGLAPWTCQRWRYGNAAIRNDQYRSESSGFSSACVLEHSQALRRCLLVSLRR